MNTKSREEKYKQAYQKAMDIIDKEWLEAGKTQEELDQERQIAELLDRLVAQGCSRDVLATEWEGMTNDEILKQYAQPYGVPAQKVPMSATPR
jgi:hypothetical protein